MKGQLPFTVDDLARADRMRAELARMKSERKMSVGSKSNLTRDENEKMSGERVSQLTRLSALLERHAKGELKNALTKRVVEICKEHNVSLKTGYRHARAGTVPCAERRIGRDGKRYPGARYPGPHYGSVGHKLLVLRYGLNSLERLAQAEGVSKDEIGALMSQVIIKAQAIYNEWSEWREEES